MMKKPPFLLLCFLMAVCGNTFAQVVEQPGRTRKIAYSKHAAIEPVADVLIEVQTEERSDGDGRFVLKIDGKNTFVYKHIYKTGYTLISPSPDELWREQALNPAVELDIVLVRTREWADEKMRIERNIRQAMESQIAEKEAELDRKEKELERLRADDADYARICGERDSLRLVTRDYYRKYGESDHFISDAAAELARIDYRDLDSIELTNVEFRKQGKGREMVAFNRSLLPANEAEIVRTLAANIDAKRKELDKALAMRDQLARRYKDIADGFALQYQNDSAAFYLHRRIEIDPENWEYNREYGRFINDRSIHYQDALDIFQRCEEIAKTLYGETHQRVALSYNDKGVVYFKMGNYSLALEYAHKALDLQKRILDANHPDIAQSYNNIACVYTDTGKYDEAIEWLNKAAEIGKSALSKGLDYDLAMVYHNLGVAYSGAEQYDQALGYAERALLMRTADLDKNHEHLADSYVLLSSIYNLMKNRSMALEYAEKALEIKRFRLGENHVSVGGCYVLLGVIHAHLGNTQSAKICDERARAIYEKNTVNPLDLAVLYANLGTLSRDDGDHMQALEYYEKAERIFVDILGEDHLYTKLVREDKSKIEACMDNR